MTINVSKTEHMYKEKIKNRRYSYDVVYHKKGNISRNNVKDGTTCTENTGRNVAEKLVGPPLKWKTYP